MALSALLCFFTHPFSETIWLKTRVEFEEKRFLISTFSEAKSVRGGFMSRLCSLFWLLLIIGPTPWARAQSAPTVPDFSSGFTPYQSYHGGDIDSINTGTGSLNLHIPLISFPQRGGRLRLNFSINYNSSTVKRSYLGPEAQGYYQWSEVDTNYPSVTVVDDQDYGLYQQKACTPNPPCTHPTQEVDYYFYAVTGPDGAQHVMGYTSGNPQTTTAVPVALRSMDMTGFYLTIPDASKLNAANYTIYDKAGNKYQGMGSSTCISTGRGSRGGT